jgi:hypothetical protein
MVSRDGLSAETIFVYSSLGLNNPPCICPTPRKSRVKNLWRNKQGNCRCKMVGAGIRSFAKFRCQMQRIATTGMTSWQTALKWTVDCQVPRSGCGSQVKPVAIRSRFILLYVAILATVILFLAFHVLNAADCHNPQHTFERGTWQETEFQLPPFYIESPAVWSVISFCRATFRV